MKIVLIKKIVKKLADMAQSRTFVISVFFSFLFLLLLHRVFLLQVVEGQNYYDSFTYRIQKETELPASRGTIYDRNGKIIAFNRLANSITVEDSSLLKTNKERNEMVYHLIELIENAGYEPINNVPIELNEKGELEYTSAGNSLLRFIRNVYGKDSVDQLSEEQKAVDVDTLFDYMCHGDEDTSMFGIDDTYSTEEALKIAAIRYEIFMKRYSQYISVTVVSDVSDTLVAKIKENTAELPGVSIEQAYVREYEESKYFSNITGYCGEISEAELEERKKAGDDTYSSGDIIGKTGLEATYDAELHGDKGRQIVYVDSLGNILEVAERTEPTTGNNLHLTIDYDYQVQAYNLLEEEIAGILIQKIVTEGSDQIPINDVYSALIKNGIIDLYHFEARDASELEKKIYKLYESKEASGIKVIRELLDGTNKKTYNECSEIQREYIELVENILVNNGILDTSKTSSSDETEQLWSTGRTSLYEYLHYAIGKNAIVVKAMDISELFLNKKAIYDALINFIMLELEDNNEFSKIVYTDMLNKDTINGTQICLVLYEQGIFEKDKLYTRLEEGDISARDFIINKIQNLEITPDMLALDPCSGSLVATNPNTGEVLALVSYPSYDANRIGNSAYFASLLENQSLPLYNRAMLQKTAPGSTFKMITSAAGLEEGIITPDTEITDKIVFEKVQPSASCWSTKYSHGSIDVKDALKESCNYFFYEVGYQLGFDSKGNYNSEYGIQRLRKYMSLFGLDRPSGIELEESDPMMSDMDPVLSSIGQARNSYTPSQIARYLTAVANRGDLYDLTILDKLSNDVGEVIEDYNAEIIDHINFKESTWDAIHEGMYRVIGNSSFYGVFKDLDVDVAGKSGTAQENAHRPDHGLFVAFAPYENPQITVTVVLPFGYGSGNSGSVAKNMFSYVFHETDVTDGTRQAASVSNTSVSD